MIQQRLKKLKNNEDEYENEIEIEGEMWFLYQFECHVFGVMYRELILKITPKDCPKHGRTKQRKF